MITCKLCMQFLFMSVLFECELLGGERGNRKITTIDVILYKKVKKPQIVLVIRIITLWVKYSTL